MWEATKMLERDIQLSEAMPVAAEMAQGVVVSLSGEETQGQTRVRRGRGFASIDPDRRREISSKGGKAAHAKGTAHEFTSEEGRAAGRKGQLARSQRHH